MGVVSSEVGVDSAGASEAESLSVVGSFEAASSVAAVSLGGSLSSS